MFLSTMNASSTRTLPPTVRRMHAAKQIAMNIVCHNANGGRTGVGPFVDVGKSLAMRVSLRSWKNPASNVPLKYGKPLKLLLLLWIHCSNRSLLQWAGRWSSNCEHCWKLNKRSRIVLQSFSKRTCSCSFFFFIFLQTKEEKREN